MTLTGNFAGLKKVEQALRALGQVPREAAPLVAQEVNKLLKKEFSGSTDPYGKAWKPLKYRKGKPLVKSGSLASSARAYPVGGKVQVGPILSYGIYHQTGTKRMVARKILPDRGLPAAWREAIEKAIEKALSRKIGKP